MTLTFCPRTDLYLFFDGALGHIAAAVSFSFRVVNVVLIELSAINSSV